MCIEPPLPLDIPVALPNSSAITVIGAHADIQRQAVVAVGRDHAILRLARCHQAGADGFLADIQMQETADLTLLVKFRRALFYPADQDHLVV
jgi:2-methylisocitrate lyase-like PEP mutase family enzyme